MATSSRQIKAEQWEPVGVSALEENALEVVRSEDHRSVIAGPGAGKTELLAQRAAFLLQTGTARAPRRILAISFKRDAAANLIARVRRRCHPIHADRLDSMTFAAFAKSLVDRFGQSLPDMWRPTVNYQVLLPSEKLYREFLAAQRGVPSNIGYDRDVHVILPATFERVFLLGSPLPEHGWNAPTPGQWAAGRFWSSALHKGSQSNLSFPMLGRLAELILRINPTARMALQLTYSHLFMDEFQDTTPDQYDLMRGIFLGSDTVITAVGDNKQQIMRWAMAMQDPFGKFEADFGAKRTPLYNNYRSSPDLVRIQHVLAKALDAQAVEPISKAEEKIDGNSCEIWNFSTPAVEARHLSEFVANEIRRRQLGARDFVLLVRQTADAYAAVLEPHFAAAGLSLRNEAGLVGAVALQDLLAEDASQILLDLLQLAMSRRSGRHWTSCQRTLAWLWGVSTDDDISQARLAQRLDEFALQLKEHHRELPQSDKAATSLIDELMAFIGRDRLISAIPSYRQGGWLDKVLNAISVHLLSSSEGKACWDEALDAYQGVDAVPLMTIHKSKGLEYDTVIFIGLDDGAWWNFSKDEAEATAGFFVAFTRAKQRVVFTYCPQRGAQNQIASLYQLLDAAGVGSQDVA